MAELSGFPYFEVQFTKKGKVVKPEEVDELLAHLDKAPPTTDLVVISHGWNNDIARARELYRDFFASLRAVIDGRPGDPLGGRRLAVAGIFWPSKKFADKALIPGGAASIDDDVSDEELERQIDDLKDGFDLPDADERLERARKEVILLEDSPAARRRFVDELRALVGTGDVKEDSELPEVGEDFLALPGDELLDRLGKPSKDEEAAAASTGGAADLDDDGPGAGAGSAAGLGEFANGIRGGARNFLNLLTYYKMKERAGKIGRSGVHDLLKRIQARHRDLKLHLVGHSFGGRLVTAAALGPDGPSSLELTSLTLLQTAYSHNGLAENWDGDGNDGLFRPVLSENRIRGPVLVTHTANDTAVGRAYPLASRIARQAASALGDANDKYGGIGRNGAQNTPEAVFEKLLAVGGDYDLKAGTVHNLLADPFIANHSDVAGEETAYAVLEALRTT